MKEIMKITEQDNMNNENNIYKTLSAINVDNLKEKKNGLDYLSWANAWALLINQYPEANYTVHLFNGKPYLFDEDLGYIVKTSVTIENITRDMFLPVLDGSNKAQTNKPYIVKTKYKDIPVQKATMFDINTAIMRCLVKNIALFGLGLNLYTGEDLPTDNVNTPEVKKEVLKPQFLLNNIQAKQIQTALDGGRTIQDIVEGIKNNFTLEKEVEDKIFNKYSLVEIEDIEGLAEGIDLLNNN